MLRLAVSVQHRLVTDRRHTTAAYTALAWRRTVKMLLYVKHRFYLIICTLEDRRSDPEGCFQYLLPQENRDFVYYCN